MDEKVRYDDIVRGVYADHCPVPFTSAVIDDCIEPRARLARGRRALQHLHHVRAWPSGTVADALSAIRTHVFEKRTVTMAALVEALDRNWDGHELLRETLVNKTPHYGNDDDQADELAALTQRIFCDAVEAQRDVQGARYFVDLLPTTSHVALGRSDGRDAGRPARRDAAVRGGVGGAGARPPGADRRGRVGGQAGPRAHERHAAQHAHQPAIACARRRTCASWRR